MKLSLLASVVALVACHAAASSAAPEAAPAAKPIDLKTRVLDPKVNRDWLQLDVDMLQHTRSLLPPVADANAFFASVHAEPGAAEQRDLGFGLTRKSARVAGGYTTCTFTGITLQGALLSVRADCGTSTDPDTLKAITPIVQEALGQGFTRDGASSMVWLYETATYELPAASARARATLDRDLGPLTPIDVGALAPDVAKAYAEMMSPLEDLAVGSSCGLAGVPPNGRKEAQTLQAAGNVDLLRNVLRGPNPEARVYAARALTKLGGASTADAALIKKLSTQPFEIRTCSGCTFFSKSSDEAFRAKD